MATERVVIAPLCRFRRLWAEGFDLLLKTSSSILVQSVIKFVAVRSEKLDSIVRIGIVDAVITMPASARRLRAAGHTGRRQRSDEEDIHAH